MSGLTTVRGKVHTRDMTNRTRPQSRKVTGRDGRTYYVTPIGYVTGWEAPRPMAWTTYRYTPNVSDYEWDGGVYDALTEALLDL